MTEFQRKICTFLEEEALNGMASTWEIAVSVFPEKWANPQSRGAMVANIRKATRHCEHLGWIGPKTRWDAGHIFCDNGRCFDVEEEVGEITRTMNSEEDTTDGR